MYIPCISRETSLIMDIMSTILRVLDVCGHFLIISISLTKRVLYKKDIENYWNFKAKYTWGGGVLWFVTTQWLNFKVDLMDNFLPNQPLKLDTQSYHSILYNGRQLLLINNYTDHSLLILTLVNVASTWY